MSKSDQLFKLIKSLSVEEKHFFIKNDYLSTRKTIPLYAILFETIDGTETEEVYVGRGQKYDENVLRKKIKDKRLLDSMAVYKNTLYERLLKSMRNFHVKHSIQIKLSALVQDIHILLEKELFEQAYKRLRIAKQLAIKYDFPHMILDLTNTERRLIRRFERQKQMKLLEEVNHQSISCVSELNLHVEILNVYDKFHTRMRGEQLGQDEKDQTMSLISGLQNQINESETNSFHLLRDYHTLLFNFYYSEKRIDEALLQQEKILKLYTDSTQMINEYPDRYASLIYNYMTILLRKKRYERVPSLLKELRKLTKSKKEKGYGIKLPKIHARVFQLSYFIELSLELLKGEVSRATALVSKIEKGLERHQQNIPVPFQIMFFQNIAMSYFLCKEYLFVLDWINRILSLEDTHKIKMNTRLLSRLLQVIVHYELEDYGLVADHFIPSFRKHLNRYKTHPEIKKYAPTYRILLSALSKASNATKDKKKKIFQDLAKQAKEIPLFATILPWIEEKAQ